MRRRDSSAQEVVLRLSREQVRLLKEAVDEYIYELEHHTLPPSKRQSDPEIVHERPWAIEKADRLYALLRHLERA